MDLRMAVADKQHDDMKRVRNEIQRSFEKLECFLMPHPGSTVAENPPNFGGKISGKSWNISTLKYSISDIRDQFIDQLRVCVPRIVDPKNMFPKEINGQPVTCRELFVYFKAYAEIFSGETLPEPKSLLSVRS